MAKEINMYTPFLREHEEDLIKIITDAVEETFQTYFSVGVTFQNLPVPYGQQKDPVMYEAVVHNDIIDGAVIVSFETDTLKALTKIVYPPELALEKEAIDGCAEEIANIIGTRVKNYLNDYNLNLQMDVPHVMKEFDAKNNFLHISFAIINNSMIVDLILKEHHADSQS